MTVETPRAIAAGWYQDPDDTGVLRWWNGLAWTEHSAPRPAGADHADHTAGAETTTG